MSALLQCREAATPQELEICYAIRRQVFVDEQGLFATDDRDGHDDDAIHYMALAGDVIIGTVRIYCDSDGLWWGGRLAVLKRHRGRAGRLLIHACVERVRREGARQFRACVQQDNVAFFKTLGWVPVGETILICNRPHQVMQATLQLEHQGDSMLKDIIAQIRSYPGLTRKRDIYRITNILQTVTDFGDTVADFGEDAAAIYYNGEYLLLAVDGIWSGLLDANPYGAGKAAVMASVNDIYAMGGRPLAMVNVIGAAPDGSLDDIVRGIRKGCEKFRVPMVGGHLHPDTGEQQLSVAIMGRATRLLRSNNAVPGQDIMFAVDLDGKGYQCRPVLSWDTNSGKKTPQILERLEVLPQLAEQQLCSTAKDVSNAGVLGTIALMMETSETGAHIDIDSIPKPESFSLIDWLKAFLSYGFVLCVDKQKSAEVAAMFTEKNITAAVIGTVLQQRTFTVGYQGACETLFDFEKEDVTGIARDYGLQNMPV